MKANANEARLLTGERDPAADAFFGTLPAGLKSTGWNPAAPSLRDTLAAAAEAGARATESWGAVA